MFIALKNINNYIYRLMSRADIIQKRLEEESVNLERYQQTNQKKGETLNKEVDEELQKLLFKKEILESRANKFEATSLKKYEMMDKKLSEDPRLQALKNK